MFTVTNKEGPPRSIEELHVFFQQSDCADLELFRGFQSQRLKDILLFRVLVIDGLLGFYSPPFLLKRHGAMIELSLRKKDSFAASCFCLFLLLSHL